MTLPWWAAVAPAATTVTCGSNEHGIGWREGSLVLNDHTDLEAEQALGALGGDVPHCVFVRNCWDKHAGNPAVVTLGRRPREAEIGLPAEEVAAAFSTATQLQARFEHLRHRAELVMLFALPGPFIDRLVLTAMSRAAEAWSDAGYRETHGLRLGAALASRAESALRRFAQLIPGSEGKQIEVQCVPASSDRGIAIQAEADGDTVRLSAALPLRWLPAVWGAGISEPGALVLSVTGSEDERLLVEIAQWERAGEHAWEAVAMPAVLVRDEQERWRVSPQAT